MRPIILALSLFLAPLAAAQSLTTERANDFIASLEDVNGYAETLDEAVRGGVLEEDIMPALGEPFAPYSKSTEYFRNSHEEVYDEMSEIVGGYDFASMEEWAATGDRVAMAYMALQMEGSDMAAITPEMLEQVPPQMRAQMEMVLAMMETVRKVPPEDIETIRPLAGELEQHLGMSAN